jgi:hypothetical protein
VRKPEQARLLIDPSFGSGHMTIVVYCRAAPLFHEGERETLRIMLSTGASSPFT